MVRTKKHFRPPSPSSSSSSSSDDDDDSDHQQPIVGAARGGGKQLRFPGGGKQLSMMAGGRPGGGKQLRMPTQGDSDKSDDSDDSSDDDDEEEEAPPKPTVTYGRPGGGKQFRVGGGKQLRAPQMDDDDDDSSSESSEDEEEEEETKPTQVYRPQFGGKAFNRGGGKQLRPPSLEAEEDDSSSSSESEEEAPPPPVVVRRGQGGGKQLRPPTAANHDDEDDDSADDMEESEEEDEAYEEEEVKKAPEPEPEPPKQPEPEPEPEPESESESEAEPETRRSQPTRASTRSTRSTKKVIEEESSDSESSSSSEEEQEWGVESFDTQKLVQSEADKEYLDSLPELEREAILAERFEKLKSEADMKKALRENKRKEREQKKSAKAQKGKSSAKKRGAATKPKAEPPKKKEKAQKKKIIEEEEEEGEEVEHDEIEKDVAPDTSGDAALAESMSGKRVSTRNLDAKGDKFKKAAALAKIRENLATKAPTKDDSESDLDYGKDSDDSDDDDDYVETSVKPWQQKGRKTTRIAASESDESVADNFDDRDDRGDDTQRRDIEADVEDYGKVTIPRRRLIRWCNEPYFEQAVTDFYVRLGIGRDMKTQKACYRLCKIVGVETKTEYSFPPVGNQKPISTNKWLQVTFGKHQTSFKMITVSDHRPSADDVAKYVSQLKTDRLRDDILLKKHANKLRKKQDELVTNYTYTKEDIENLIKDKKKRSKKASNIGLEKTRIGIAVQAARDAVEDAKRRIEDAKVERMEANDVQAMAKAEGDLKRAQEALEDAESNLVEKLEEQKRIHKDEQERINKMKKSSKIQNWVKVNQRAKLANQHADFQSYKEQRAKEQAAGSAEPKFDPYARRKVKPKNLWEVGGKDKKSENMTDDGAQEEKKDSSHPNDRDDSIDVKDEKEAKRDEVPESQKVEMPGQSNQYAFDDDIMIGGDITTIGLGVKKVKSRVRKGLSLDDYHERKTAGTL